MGKTDSTIKKRLGAQWEKLHPNVQERFAHDPKLGETIHYHGEIDTTRSRAGWLFAHLTRIIGNPLTPYQGNAIPLDVRLFQKDGHEGVFWQRTYHFPDKAPYVVTSIKKAGRAGEDMLECVGGGFGMLLDVYADAGHLHFKSRYYFWELGTLRIRLPAFITPGETHVIHEDKGEGNFRFTITMTHIFLGRTFYQDGIFRRKEA